MKRRLISVILFALVAAAASSTVLYKIISANSQPAVRAAATRVIVAARDLNAGAVVGEEDVRTADWPASSASQWLARKEDVVGRGLIGAINKDEPFGESRLAGKGAGAGLASRIPSGMRLVAVHADELSGLSRIIAPGMHVDVISSGASGNPGGQNMVTRTILQNIEVFSTGQNVEHDARDKPAAVQSFDLLVTPPQAEVLSQAVAQSRIQLVLRNPLDKGSFVPELIPPARVPFDTPPPKRPKAALPAPAVRSVATPAELPRQSPPTVEVIHGAKRTFSVVSSAAEPETKQ
jgi:pilus assembly protein CpaB